MKDLDKKLNRLLSESELVNGKTNEEITLPSSFSDAKDIASYTTGLRRISLYAKRLNTPVKFAMFWQLIADLSKAFPSNQKQIMIFKAVRDAFEMKYGSKFGPSEED